jgi:iduronate 2-sulfatase
MINGMPMPNKFYCRFFSSRLTLAFYIAILILLSSQNTYTQTVKETPNVLFIAVDDLKPILGCYGDTLIKTPNIDALAKRGTVFLANYCQQAVSGPTRASLLTGKRPDYTRIYNMKTKMRDMNPDILTLPQYFRSCGYTTTGVGKIYDPRCVDENLDKPSWSIPFTKKPAKKYFNEITGEPAFGFYQQADLKEKALKGRSDNGSEEGALKDGPSIECANVPDDAYLDGATVKKAKELLESLAHQDKPFFLAVGIHNPHLPFVAPKKYWDLYKREQMPVAKFQEHAANSPEFAYTASPELRAYTDIPALVTFSDQKNSIHLPVDKQQELIHGYYAAVSYADAQIGVVLKTLDSLGLAGNTIIILWGDHGWHLGDHDLWCKHTDFEQATHAPLIISAPGILPSRCSSQTEFIDIFPTLCELTGLQIPDNRDGLSLVPLMNEPSKEIKKYSVSQYGRKRDKQSIEGYSIRTKRYRYTEWLSDFKDTHEYSEDKIAGKELYDYEKDPLETVSRIDDPAYRDVQAEMKKLLMEYFNSQKDNLGGPERTK